MPAAAKRPAMAAPPSGGKQPRALPTNRDEIMNRQIVWRFQDVDNEGSWGFAGLDGAGLVDLMAKLGHFESMTVRELFYKGEEPGKQYDVEGLPAPTLARLVELRRDDETKLARLRLTGPCRLYGFMREHVFHVLWWDPQHQVYPSQKRHT
jgi:hypothetical protein